MYLLVRFTHMAYSWPTNTSNRTACWTKCWLKIQQLISQRCVWGVLSKQWNLLSICFKRNSPTEKSPERQSKMHKNGSLILKAPLRAYKWGIEFLIFRLKTISTGASKHHWQSQKTTNNFVLPLGIKAAAPTFSKMCIGRITFQDHCRNVTSTTVLKIPRASIICSRTL